MLSCSCKVWTVHIKDLADAVNGFFRSVTCLHQREPALFFSFSLLSKQSAVSYVNADRPELTPQASFRVGATVLPSDESWYNLAASPKNQAAVCAAVDFGVFLVGCAPIPGIRHQSAGTERASARSLAYIIHVFL